LLNALRRLVRPCPAVLCFALPIAAVAQAPSAVPAAKSASCKADVSPRSEATVAYDRDEYTRAAGLFPGELSDRPTDLRLHAIAIRNSFEKGDIAAATKQADEFAAANPNSGIAQTAKAEAMIRNGQLAEGYAAAAASQKVDPCTGRTYFALAHYEGMIALYATAKRHLELAHALDPNDPEIANTWISYQPRAKALAERTKFIETTTSLTDKQRELYKKRLAKRAEQTTDNECKLTSNTQSATIPFSAIRYSPESDPAYGVEMSFNGKKRRLELDTGASGLTLTMTAAQHLGLPIEDSAYLGGFGDEGTRRSQVAHVKDLKIGDLEFSNCTVYILPPRNMDYSGMGLPPFMDDIDGLVGGDIFRKFLLTLDYPGGELKVAPLPARPNETETAVTLDTSNGEGAGMDGTPQDRYRGPEMKDWTSFYRIYHYLLIPTQLNDGPIKLLMADTGAEESLIDPAAARQVTSVATTERIHFQGISGEVKNTYLTGKLVLHFGQLYLPMSSMYASETTGLSRGAGVDVAGFLGFTALKQMSIQIDYRDDLIHFVFDPKRPANPKFARVGP
jgi:predicted aspartyl protease